MSDTPPPPIRGTLESVLYASNLHDCFEFYTRVLGLPSLGGPGQLSFVVAAGPDSVLLVFDPAKSSPPGRDVPSHGSTGPGHFALRIDADQHRPWLDHLTSLGVPVEQEHTWEDGSRSIYLRDPADNSVELIDGDIWRSGRR